MSASRPQFPVPLTQAQRKAVALLLPELARYHIVFTTPYILMASMDDWLQFLSRALPGSGDDREALHRLLKSGPEANYWNEFVFKAYHYHQSDAIFLAGIPDLKATLPHA